MKCQCPALGFAQPAVARHRGARDAECQGIVIAQQVALITTLQVMKIGGRRAEARRCRAVPVPLGAVAAGTLLLIDSGPHSRVRCLGWADRDWIIGQEQLRQMRCQRLHAGTSGFIVNRTFHLSRQIHERGLARCFGQSRQPAADVG